MNDLRCPFCHMLIPRDAIECSYCHKLLDAYEFPETKEGAGS